MESQIVIAVHKNPGISLTDGFSFVLTMPPCHHDLSMLSFSSSLAVHEKDQRWNI